MIFGVGWWMVDVFERVLPITTAPNHSMLGSYLICIDHTSYLEYTRAYWHVKKRVKIEKSYIERSKTNTIFAENSYERVLPTVPPPLGYN